MFAIKCPRFLRFGSRPSVKLLKAVIGIGLSSVRQRLKRRVPLQSVDLRVTFRSRKSKPAEHRRSRLSRFDAIGPTARQGDVDFRPHSPAKPIAFANSSRSEVNGGRARGRLLAAGIVQLLPFVYLQRLRRLPRPQRESVYGRTGEKRSCRAGDPCGIRVPVMWRQRVTALPGRHVEVAVLLATR